MQIKYAVQSIHSGDIHSTETRNALILPPSCAHLDSAGGGEFFAAAADADARAGRAGRADNPVEIRGGVVSELPGRHQLQPQACARLPRDP